MKNLNYLKELILWRNEQVTDISVLSGLKDLEYLDITRNQIEDISALKNLKKLKHLKFRNNNVNDISALEKLYNLEYLHFGGSPQPEAGNKVENISALANLNNLEYINFYDNNISDISPLINNEGLGKDDYIDMRFNHLDISEGSEDLKIIKTLEARGIEIDYMPQKK